MSPELREILAVALRAVEEAGVSRAAVTTLRGAVAGKAAGKAGVMPAGGVRRIEWCARRIAAAAGQGDLDDVELHMRAMVRDLFAPVGIGEEARRPSEIQAAWKASVSRSVAALLDVVAPPPRVLAPALAVIAGAKRSAAAHRKGLAAGPAAGRVAALRAVPRAMLESLVVELAALAVDDPEPYVRAEAVRIAAGGNQKLRARFEAIVQTRVAVAPAAALAALAAIKRAPPADVLAALLVDPASATVRAAACACVRAGPVSRDVEAGLLLALRDADTGVRAAALSAVSRWGIAQHATKLDSLVDALRIAARVGPDIRHAIYLLGQLGPRAAAAGLDVCRQLAATPNPYQAHETLVAFGSLPPPARAILEGHARGPRSDVASAAEAVLSKVLGVTLDIPVQLRLDRARAEIESVDRDVRSRGIFAARRGGMDAAPLVPALRALGERVATDDTIEGKAELSRVREALTALGCSPTDLPRPPSRFEAWRGNTPRERAVDGPYMIGEITSFVRHGAVSVPTSSLGLWEQATGALVFVVPDAQLLALVPGRDEAATLRTIVKADAKHGGTSRADLAWMFSRHAIPSGEIVASLALPESFTYGWPSHLSISDGIAHLVGGDEDEPYQFTIALASGPKPDRLLDPAPVPLKRRRTAAANKTTRKRAKPAKKKPRSR
jgi:hypothetical protein